MNNKQLASKFKLLGGLIELSGGNDFKAKSYQNAAFKLSKWPADIFSLPDDEISRIDGIGSGILAKITELKQSGSMAEMDVLLQQIPAGVVEMLGIKGIGPKKVREIWQGLQIETVGELLYACNENRLVNLKGFGEKTQHEIVKAIEFKISNQGRMLYVIAAEVGKTLIAFFENAGAAKGSMVFTGELRRLCEVVDEIELIGKDVDANKLAEALATSELVSDISVEYTSLKFKMNGNNKVVVHLATAANFNFKLWETTGSAAHIALLKYEGSEAVTEEEIYQSKGLHYIAPELREGWDEVELAANTAISEGLLELKDIKGMLHNHSTYSDGLHSLREMALYCKSLGYEYLGISDHSQTAVYAGGLKPEKIKLQHAEIDELNKELAPFKILKGIESDVLNDGSLDYTDDVLASFDFVVASIHQNFKMTEEQATQRLIKAIENPYTTILGHMTGRLLLARNGYPVDHEAIIDACAKYGVVIELNANPYRLDIDWRWIKLATDKGVKISINPDAHAKEGFHDTYYGVNVARKGYLKPKATFNCFTLAEIEAYLSNRKQN